MPPLSLSAPVISLSVPLSLPITVAVTVCENEPRASCPVRGRVAVRFAGTAGRAARDRVAALRQRRVFIVLGITVIRQALVGLVVQHIAGARTVRTSLNTPVRSSPDAVTVLL